MWMEKDFEIEMSLEQKQLEKELQEMSREYNVPQWDNMDDLNDMDRARNNIKHLFL